MFERVFVPLDESELAEEALAFAKDLVDQSSGELFLEEVCDLPAVAMSMGSDTPNKLLRSWLRKSEGCLQLTSSIPASERSVHIQVLTRHASHRSRKVDLRECGREAPQTCNLSVDGREESKRGW